MSTLCLYEMDAIGPNYSLEAVATRWFCSEEHRAAYALVNGHKGVLRPGEDEEWMEGCFCDLCEQPLQRALTKYHAFEIVTDTAYHLWVDEDQEAMNRHLVSLQADLGNEIETICIGTIEEATIEDAIRLIRSGKWQYSQRI